MEQLGRHGFDAVSARIRGFPAIQLGRAGSPETEYRLQGRQGWIREAGEGRLVVHYTQLGAARLKLPKIRRGEEGTAYYPAEALPQLLKAVGYIKTRPGQARLANNWGK